MYKFKVGDKVIRFQGGTHGGMNENDQIGIITKINDNKETYKSGYSIFIDITHNFSHDPENIKLIEPTKPKTELEYLDSFQANFREGV